MKLTSAQQKIIDRAKEDIDFARTHSIREWAIKQEGLVSEEYIEHRAKVDMEKYGLDFRRHAETCISRRIENYSNYYENEKIAIVLTWANSKTLEALERMGLIEIIHDGRSYSDTIKLLNY